MKKQNQLALSFIIITSLFIFSCNNKDTPDPTPKTKTQLLTQATWKFSSASAAGTDITNNSLLACIKDDVTTFVSTGTGNISDGAILCSPTTGGNFTWSFQSSETVLVMSAGLFPGGSGTFNIVSLTDLNLIVSQNVIVPPSSSPINVQFTFIH